ncbi:MAG: hypothetical protein KDJ69_04575 [Nitratireductor sp.]|nr:hypothetical protein [Nitratireductor sp.]
MLKYLRFVNMTVDGGALSISELKVGFTVRKTLSSENNDAEFDIWNLTSAHRMAFSEEYKEIEFEAGYTPPMGGSNVAMIFKGYIRDVEHRRDGTDIITNVKCGDGDKGTRKGVVCKTHPTGTKPRQIIEDVINNMEGVEIGELKGIDALPPSRRPVVTMGTGLREIDKLSRTHRFHWMINDGILETCPENEFLNGMYIISQQTGMLDVPTITDKGVNVDVLLEPQILPGRQVDVRSETLDMNGAGGQFRVHNVTHSGDNRNGDFKTSIEAVRLGE